MLGNSAGKLVRGVDSRGQGGFVVGPPSVHPAGEPYRWLRAPIDTLIIETPAWIIERLQPAPRKPPPAHRERLTTGTLTSEGQRRLVGIVRRVETAAKGERHDVLFWAACRIAELVAANHVDARLGEHVLCAAVEAYGLIDSELRAAERTIRDGLEIGGRA